MNRWRLRGPWPDQRRRIAFESMWTGASLIVGVGLPLVMTPAIVAVSVPHLSGAGITAVAIIMLVGTVCSVVGGVMSVKGFRRARPYEDRVWSDDTDLWWVRHRPRVPGAEPAQVARRDIVEVGLTGDDGAVVVRTADGTEYTVTDLGSPTDRIALVAALGERVAPETARITPASPLALPRRWRSRTGEKRPRSREPVEKGTVIWRRPSRLRPLVLGAIAVVAFRGMILASDAPKEWVNAALLLAFAANCVVFMVVFREFALPGRGWLVGNGGLEVVEIRARSGEVAGEPRRVTALDVRPRRWARFARLDAVLGDGERVKIMGGRAGRIRALAGWLADRADLPLTGNTPGVIGMTVASRQVSR